MNCCIWDCDKMAGSWIVEQEKVAVAKQWHSKHIFVSADSDTKQMQYFLCGPCQGYITRTIRDGITQGWSESSENMSKWEWACERVRDKQSLTSRGEVTNNRETPSSYQRGGPFLKHVEVWKEQIYVVMGPIEAQNNELLCWRGPTAICWSCRDWMGEQQTENFMCDVVRVIYMVCKSVKLF
jgi:hypothetical protein